MEKHFGEKWLKFNSGTLFMSSNFILGNIEVRDYMVEARSRQGNISRMYNSISRTKSIDRWEMGKQKLEDKISKIDGQSQMSKIHCPSL